MALIKQQNGDGGGRLYQGFFIPGSVEIGVFKCFNLLARLSCLCETEMVAVLRAIFLP